MAMRARQIAVCRRLAMIAGFLLVLAPVMVHSSQALAGAPAATTSDDTLPEGAVVRLGTDRFRQEGEVLEVRYSPDGSKLASISRDAIIIWDARKGRQLRRLRPRNEEADADRLSSLAFSPDGEEIAAAGSSQIYVWEVETGLELLSFPISTGPGMMDGVAIRYSPNGERLAVGGSTSVLLYDTSTGEKAAD